MNHWNRPVLRLLGLSLLLVLALVACAGETPPVDPSPTALATSPTRLAPTASHPPPSPTMALPTASPTTGPATAPAQPADESPWPAFLHELDYGIPAGNSYGPRSLAVHPGLGRLYVRTHGLAPLSADPGQVTVLDLASGEVLDVVETGPDTYAEGGLSLDMDRERLYALNVGDTTCTVLDAAGLGTVATLDGVEQLAVDAERGQLYVAGLGQLRVLDGQNYGPVDEVSIGDSPRFLDLGLDSGGGRLYLLYEDAGDIFLSLHDAQTLDVLSSRPLPGRPDDLIADTRLHRAYLTLEDGENSLLWVVDGSGELLFEQRLGTWTQNTVLALDAEAGRLFLGREDYRNNGVARLDTDTLQRQADIPLADAPNALTWDPAGQRLLASQTYANQITILNPEAAQVQATYPTAISLVDAAVGTELGYLYLTDTTGKLHVLDSHGETELATLPGEGHLSVDSAHGRLYTGGGGADEVRIFAASGNSAAPVKQTGAIRTRAKPVADGYHDSLYVVDNGIYLTDLEALTITTAISDTLPEEGGFSPNPRAVDAVVDPGTGRIFAIINNGVPGSNNGNYLYVYEPETFERILADAERSAAYVDIDPNTGRAYVGRLYMTLRSTSLLVDGQAYGARLDSLSGPLRVDPGLGRVYLTGGSDTGDYLIVLDAGSLDVQGAVPIPAGLALEALDTERHLLYLAAGEGRLQIWSATGGELPGPVEPTPAELPVEQVRQFTVGPSAKTILAGSLYRSEDEGRSWVQIGAGLPDMGVSEAIISPDLARDQTLFAVTAATDAGLGIWKSVDGGRTWGMANTGLSDMAVIDLAVSPAFGQDETLFATTRRQGLFRSTDGGRSWLQLTGRYYEPQGYVEPPGDVVLSPTYAQDHTLFVAHDGLHRSVDGGESWQQIFAENPASLALSADPATDGVVYAWFSSAGLLRSEDWGDTWRPVSGDLPLQGYGSGQVLVPVEDAGTVYFVWMPSAPDMPAQYFRSQDGAVSWQRLETDLGQIITPVQLDPQGTAFLALDGQGKLVRWPVEDLHWQPVSLPPISQIEFHRLIPSPAYRQNRILYAVTEGAGILRSQDAGLTWQSTEFPVRVVLGGPPELVVQEPDTLLAGTELGLYRWQGGGPWRLNDGLPQGMAVTGPVMGADGALVVLVGAGSSEPQIYLSTDGGESWTQPVPALPYPAILEDLVLSPAFASDRTAFVVGSREPLRSVNGGPWQAFGPPGQRELSAFDLSPAFDQDGLLFMRLYDNSLWRSTDGGDAWTEVTSDWTEAPMGIARGSGYRLPAVTFSPDYRRDGVLLTRVGEVLYRSTDDGTSWAPVLSIGPRYAQGAFSPTYGRDGTIFLLQGRSLWRSVDRGATWQPLPTAPWTESDEIQLKLSPTFAQDGTAVAWSMNGQFYRSSDNGQTWRDISTGLTAPGIRQVLFSPDYAQSRVLFVIPFGGGVRKLAGQGPLVPITEDLATPPPAVTPTPPPTPAPTACPGDPGPFGTALDQIDHRLGCPQGPAAQVQMAAQSFERGSMIWVSSTQQIYVLYDSGRWKSYADTFVEGVDPAYDPDLPPPPRQPQRGFGKVWREQLGGPGAAVGWALENERAVAGWRQPFANGLLLWIDAPADATTPGFANLLHDDGTWQAVPTAAPQ